MKKCLASCLPACSYWNYELTYVESHTKTKNTDSMETILIAPISDYIEFTQRRAYTWFKIVAEIGGLLYV